MSAATTFQTARESSRPSFSQSSCSRPRNAVCGARRRLQVGGVRAAVRAHVEHEQVEQRTVAVAPVDALRLARVERPHRRVVEEGPRAARDEQRDVLLAVARVCREVLRVRPVVRDFVVVPLPDLRHFGVEAAHVLVEQVVAIAAAELVQRLGDLGSPPA